MFSTGHISLGLTRLKDHKGFKVFMLENFWYLTTKDGFIDDFDIEVFVLSQLDCTSLQELADSVNEVFYGMTLLTYRKDMEDEFIANEIYGLLCDALGVEPSYELNYDVY